jgi:hypothetical protein
MTASNPSNPHEVGDVCVLEVGEDYSGESSAFHVPAGTIVVLLREHAHSWFDDAKEHAEGAWDAAFLTPPDCLGELNQGAGGSSPQTHLLSAVCSTWLKPSRRKAPKGLDMGIELYEIYVYDPEADAYNPDLTDMGNTLPGGWGSRFDELIAELGLTERQRKTARATLTGWTRWAIIERTAGGRKRVLGAPDDKSIEETLAAYRHSRATPLQVVDLCNGARRDVEVAGYALR